MIKGASLSCACSKGSSRFNSLHLSIVAGEVDALDVISSCSACNNLLGVFWVGQSYWRISLTSEYSFYDFFLPFDANKGCHF